MTPTAKEVRAFFAKGRRKQFFSQKKDKDDAIPCWIKWQMLQELKERAREEGDTYV